jgi:hypothetical protein
MKIHLIIYAWWVELVENVYQVRGLKANIALFNVFSHNLVTIAASFIV